MEKQAPLKAQAGPARGTGSCALGGGSLHADDGAGGRVAARLARTLAAPPKDPTDEPADDLPERIRSRLNDKSNENHDTRKT